MVRVQIPSCIPGLFSSWLKFYMDAKNEIQKSGREIDVDTVKIVYVENVSEENKVYIRETYGEEIEYFETKIKLSEIKEKAFDELLKILPDKEESAALLLILELYGLEKKGVKELHQKINQIYSIQ